MSRPRHPDGDHEQLFKQAERSDWEILGGGKRHFRMQCPCKEKHMVTVSTTPKNVTSNLRVVMNHLRKTCWEEVS